tara:strand:- start:801 stop:1154 length:354 start_codon:yes stop_codon:yes gene_type:complete
MYELKFIIEVVVVGILVACIGSFVFFMGKTKIKIDRKFLFKLFLTGAIIHILCEFTGINNWYLQNGAALLNQHTYNTPYTNSSYSTFYSPNSIQSTQYSSPLSRVSTSSLPVQSRYY